MFISKKEYFVEVHAILQEGVDFKESDLEAAVMRSLKSSVASRIAVEKGFLKWTWMGHYNDETGTIEITFQNPIFVDEEQKTVILR